MYRLVSRLLTVLVLVCATVALVAAAGTTTARAAAAPVNLGLHDGSIDNCDNGGSENSNWQSGQAPPVHGAAAQQGMLDSSGEPSAWFTGLDASLVRLIVPWDIALPDTNITYQETGTSPHLPAQDLLSFSGDNTSFESVHFQALRNQEACFDYWLAAARAAKVKVEVDFEADFDYRNSSYASALAPSHDTYNVGLRAFVKEYACGASTCPFFSNPAVPAGERASGYRPWGVERTGQRKHGHGRQHAGKHRPDHPAHGDPVGLDPQRNRH